LFKIRRRTLSKRPTARLLKIKPTTNHSTLSML
jgi:hypothetical protein